MVSTWETAWAGGRDCTNEKPRRNNMCRGFTFVNTAGSDLLSHTVSHAGLCSLLVAALLAGGSSADGLDMGNCVGRRSRLTNEKPDATNVHRVFTFVNNAGSDLLSHTVSRAVALFIARRCAPRRRLLRRWSNMGNCVGRRSRPRTNKKPRRNNLRRGFTFVNNAGSDLLSHTVSHAVPSAVSGLTSVFGMGTGVTLIL